MKCRALRGVCIGVDRHLKVGDVGEVDAPTMQFLTSIGAVEHVQDEPQKPVQHAPAEPVKTEPVKPQPVKEK